MLFTKLESINKRKWRNLNFILAGLFYSIGLWFLVKALLPEYINDPIQFWSTMRILYISFVIVGGVVIFAAHFILGQFTKRLSAILAIFSPVLIFPFAAFAFEYDGMELLLLLLCLSIFLQARDWGYIAKWYEDVKYSFIPHLKNGLADFENRRMDRSNEINGSTLIEK